ncbi:hypothetical protein M8C21_018881 [Ambrosia artemisiifolia]|uniref:Uncharacterized protein n=1 Tax=Ambrosia artemisiifolia TaxID=4212 RepID=A0AAD5G1U0_AMBAR|nr:hypothetical protein M8C21_018881 [Ambrosia artemisiifolia]
MRRSFGPKMGGGGGGGGGGMMKTVHRAMRAGIGSNTSQEPSYSSHAATGTTSNRNHQHINTTLSLNRPSSPCSYLNHPAPDMPPHNLALTTSLSSATGEEFDWEYVDVEGDGVDGFYDEFVFGGGVPSEQEVHHAVTSLYEVLEPVSFDQLMNHRETYEDDARVDIISSSTGFHNSGLELDWHEPSMQQCYSTSTLQVPRSDKVCDAFHLLQTDPSVQRMVISLSSDKAVWDAVMNNEVVRELRESIREDKSIYDGSEGGVNGSNPVTQVLHWIFANTKDKVIEIVAKITKVVNELLRPMSKDEKPNIDTNVGLDSFDEKLRRSFFLSIVVLLIVVVSRSRKQR